MGLLSKFLKINCCSTMSGSEVVVEPCLVTAVCGLAKCDEPNQPPKDEMEQLSLGDASDSSENSKESDDLCRYGEDAWFVATTAKADVIGVADGVGGWRTFGIDSGEFSSYLMKTCERLVHTADFDPKDPVKLLVNSYNQMKESSKRVHGGSTACVLAFDRESSTIHVANLGDSGFIVVRDGKLQARSTQQQHTFNTPFQLSLPPPLFASQFMDSPSKADSYALKVQVGDVLMLATDGVFDNMPLRLILQKVSDAKDVSDPSNLKKLANAITNWAATLSQDVCFMSPYAIMAKKNNFDGIGGKPDDITVLMATVCAGDELTAQQSENLGPN